MTETTGYLDRHSKSHCNIGVTNFDGRPRIADRSISEAEKFEKLQQILFLEFCLSSLYSMHTVSSRGNGSLLPKRPVMSKRHAPYEVSSGPNILSGGDQCCQEHLCPTINGILNYWSLNVIFCSSLKCFKVIYVCKLYLCASREQTWVMVNL